MLRVFPQADIVVSVLSHKMRAFNDVTRKARETWLGSLPGARAHHRWFLPLEALAFNCVDTSDYDLVISSSHAFAKAIRPPKAGVHLCYCYSPPRYLWDLYGTYRDRFRGPERWALSIGVTPLRIVDQATSRRVGQFIAISEFVAARIERVYKRTARVVYPPVQRLANGPTSDPGLGRYLLHVGRLVPYKRIDLAIAAAERLRVKLIVAGDGPERRRLEHMAGRYTEFLGNVSDLEAAQLFDHCAGFVFCAEEDFGIAPVEANAHGRPVIGLRRGGLLETMLDGVTATFFEEQTVEALAAAIESTLVKKWDPTLARANAARFGVERFRDGLVEAVVGVMNKAVTRRS